MCSWHFNMDTWYKVLFFFVYGIKKESYDFTSNIPVFNYPGRFIWVQDNKIDCIHIKFEDVKKNNNKKRRKKVQLQQVTGTFEYSVINTVFGHLTNLTSISVWYISQCLNSLINTVFGHLNNITNISVWYFTMSN